jgi:hypothetical protein
MPLSEIGVKMANWITIKNKLTGEVKKVRIASALVDEWKIWGACGGSTHEQATKELKKLGKIEDGMIVIRM